MSRIIIMKILILILLLISGTVYAELNDGKVTGSVIDAVTKQPIPAANIIVIGTDIGAAADLNGYFEILLPAGTYNLRASVIGYSPLVKTDIIVRASQPVRVDFELTETAIELEGVVVTSGYFNNDPLEVNSKRTFGYEEIRRTPGGFEDVVRALSVLPGVAQAEAGRNDLVVRGGAPSENLYIIDGIEVPNINHFGTQGASGGALSFVNLDFVKETSFSSGGFSSLYGDKLSSILNINLRNGRDDRLGGKATISATQFGLNVEGPLGTGNNFLFSARRSYLDFIFKAAGFGFVPEYYDVISKADFNIDNQNSLSFLFISAFDNVRWFNETSDQILDNSRILGSDQIQYTTGITYRHLINNGFMNVILSRTFVDYNTIQRDTLLNPVFKNISRESENTLSSNLVYKFSKTTEINIGLSGKLIKFGADILLPDYITTFGDTLPLTSVNFENYFTKASGYLNLNNQFLDKWRINTGVRFDYFDEINKKFYISPRASVSYSLNDLTSVSISSGIYYQSPSYLWLALEENKSLKSIRADHLVFGFDHLLREDALLKIELYQKWYKDYPASLIRPYILLANTGAGYSGTEDNFASFGLEPLVNGGSGESRGIELSVQKKFSGMKMYGLLSITIGETKFKALDNISRKGAYNQDFIANLSGGYKFSPEWEASMKLRYSSGSPYTPFESDGSQRVSNYLGADIPPLHSLDLRVDRRWFFERLTLITYLDIQNIYNNKQSNSIRWDPKTRTADTASSIGILPSIGVSLEF
jgi:hypothetical protein